MSKLDAARIVDEAMRIIAEDGEAGLAMRPLAARLEVTPMALYRYFPDRDALLLALVARVSEEIVFPEPEADPARTAEALAACLHDFLAEHPWMIRLIATGRLASPAGMRFPDGFLDCAARAGLDETQGFVFYRTMFATILGAATISHARCETPVPVLPAAPSQATVPRVAALASRWPELDREATPRALFRSVAGALVSG